ncbi:MAG TPA: DUF559 domain-containing protein [Thermoleophilaceae bacterium]|nr:DUF559 domain-containing protein [Thermoleophilaceae bacterium]
MAGTTLRTTPDGTTAAAIWALVGRQHGVVSRRQLLEHGLTRAAIEHRIATARLHPLHRGVYAVGRPEVSHFGRWLAAVLACGPGAVLSHWSAAALWGIRGGDDTVHVLVPEAARRQAGGVVIHRRRVRTRYETTERLGIPVTTPAATIVDLAGAGLRGRALEGAINEADKLGLVTADRLRDEIEPFGQRTGARAVRRLLDRHAFRLTDSDLERRFLRIARRAGLAAPETGQRVNGFRVDFLWRDLGLVVETDGLTYHRTPAQQARDRLRDQAHTAAGLVCLRFTHAQVAFEPGHVRMTLREIATRLAASNDPHEKGYPMQRT